MATVGCRPLLDAVSGWQCDGLIMVHFTAVFRPVPGGFVAYVEELPGANAQGATLVEARANLEDVHGPSAPRDRRVPGPEDLS